MDFDEAIDRLDFELVPIASGNFPDPVELVTFRPCDVIGSGLLRRIITQEHIDLWELFRHQTNALCEIASLAEDSCANRTVAGLARGVRRFARQLNLGSIRTFDEDDGDSRARDRAGASNRLARVGQRLFWVLRKLDLSLHFDVMEAWEAWDETKLLLGSAPYVQTQIFEFLTAAGLGRHRIVCPYRDGIAAGNWWIPQLVKLDAKDEAAFLFEGTPEHARCFASVALECLEPVAIVDPIADGWSKIYMRWPIDRLKNNTRR